jgi:hypothetical protein
MIQIVNLCYLGGLGQEIVQSVTNISNVGNSDGLALPIRTGHHPSCQNLVQFQPLRGRFFVASVSLGEAGAASPFHNRAPASSLTTFHLLTFAVVYSAGSSSHLVAFACLLVGVHV